MRILIWLFFLSSLNLFAEQKKIGIYLHDPIADTECAVALKTVLDKKYKTVFINHDQLTGENLKKVDLLAFGGGLGDSDQFDEMLLDKKEVVRDYVFNGGRYLGICMGAYFAGHHYFDILKDADTVRYVSRPNSSIFREDETISRIRWGLWFYNMYFFDGCAIVGKDLKKFATYKNGDTMAAIQGRIGLIGCHPESMQDWYITEEMKRYWHGGVHHELLLKFVDELIKK